MWGQFRKIRGAERYCLRATVVPDRKLLLWPEQWRPRWSGRSGDVRAPQWKETQHPIRTGIAREPVDSGPKDTQDS